MEIIGLRANESLKLGQESIHIILWTWLQPALLRLSSRDRTRAHSTALAARGDLQKQTTRRARGVRSQPRVDASDVESVAARRQHSDLVSGDEFRQANGAIGKLADVAARVSEFGNGFEDLLLEAFVCRRRRSGDSA